MVRVTDITAADIRDITAAITAAYTPAYYGGYYDEPYYPVVRYRRVVRPAFAYYGGPRFYGPRFHHRRHWHHW